MEKAMYLDRQQMMRVTFEEICQGQDPWIPLGNFMGFSQGPKIHTLSGKRYRISTMYGLAQKFFFSLL
jgi:hypothetical protein